MGVVLITSRVSTVHYIIDLIVPCSTILVEPGCGASITVYGDIRIQVGL